MYFFVFCNQQRPINNYCKCSSKFWEHLSRRSFQTVMVSRFSELKSHKHTVFTIYRTILRNALYLPTLPNKSVHINLINKIQNTFRAERGVNNSLVCENKLKEAIYWNDIIIESYEKLDEKLLLKLSPRLRKLKDKVESQEDRLDGELNQLIKESKEKERLTKQEFQTQLRKKQMKSWTIEFIKRKQLLGLIPRKSQLDQHFINQVLISKILHFKRNKYLKHLSAKLSRPSTASLKSANITYKPGTLIFTPWNEYLTPLEYNRFFNNQRKKFDSNLLEKAQCIRYKNAYFQLYKEEMEWEQRLGIKDDEPNEEPSDWMFIFEYSDQYIVEKVKEIENATIAFNKEQYIYYQKLKPEFDEMFQNSRKNMKRLLDLIKQRKLGAYTDIVEDDLGELLKEHQFRDPLRLKGYVDSVSEKFKNNPFGNELNWEIQKNNIDEEFKKLIKANREQK